MENLERLIRELCSYPSETQWIEFKHNNYVPETIGEDICALANGAALLERDKAYFLWGVDNCTHEIIGTEHDLQTLRKGSEELENWLRGNLSPNADFEYYLTPVGSVKVGVLIIHAAVGRPIAFRKVEYIRIGSYTKKLIEYPEVQSRLWRRLQSGAFEDGSVRRDLSAARVVDLLDVGQYFRITGIPYPSDAEGVCHYLREEGIVEKQDNGLYCVTNLGAILFAHDLNDFPSLARKAVRIAQFDGNSRFTLLKDFVEKGGYAASFQTLIDYVAGLLPSREPIEGALREVRHAYPLLAVRETVANALIHQDFSISGTGPTVEIFDNRIEITNPGVPLVAINRIIDNPPKSRNERLASLMRRLRMCEELGTGWDKIVDACERQQLPAPKIELFAESTKVTLYAYVPFERLSPDERLWACYLHACLLYVQGEYLTNSSLRGRFGVQSTAAGSISRLIKTAVGKGLIVPYGATTAPRHMKYLPFWGA